MRVDTLWPTELWRPGTLKKILKTFDTPAGSHVTVQAGSITVSFSAVTAAGSISIAPLDSTATGGFSLSNNLGAYDVSTTAFYNGPITTCFPVSGVDSESTFNRLMVFHVEYGTPVNVTTSHDFSHRLVCGTVNSLSPFVVVKGPSDQLVDLITLVRSYNLRNGVANSLDATLQNAESALNAAKARDGATACNQMAAFVSEIRAQSGKAITEGQAARLIAAAREIQVLLGCR